MGMDVTVRAIAVRISPQFRGLPCAAMSADLALAVAPRLKRVPDFNWPYELGAGFQHTPRGAAALGLYRDDAASFALLGAGVDREDICAGRDVQVMSFAGAGR